MSRPQHLSPRLVLTTLVTSLVVAGATASPSAYALAGTFENAAAITVVGAKSIGPSSPYPSTVNVAAMSGTVTSVSLTLTGLRQTFPDDMDMLLVGPTGANLVVWSDVGGNADLTGQSVTLADGSPPLPDTALITAGTYAPTNVTAGDAFAAPAPAPSAATTFAAAFDGTDPTGGWQLYVVDDASDDAGTIGGWSVTVSTTGSPATTFGTNTPTIVPGGGGSAPYPESINVAGVTGLVSGVSVTLNHITHPAGADLDVMVVGPSGESIVLMSDIAGAMNDVTLTFEDSGPPMAGSGTSGTFHPTNANNNDWFPYPAPVSGPSTGFAPIFGGTDPNGTWKLFVLDDTVANDGTVAGGWSLTVETKLPQTIDPGVSPPAPAVGDSYVVMANGGGSSSPVVIGVNASTTNAACTVDMGTIVHFDHAGSCVLDFSQEGDAEHFAAPTVQVTTAVAKAAQPLFFLSEPPTPGRINTTYVVAYDAGQSGNPAVLSVDPMSTPGACTVDLEVVTFTGEGTCSLFLDQAGNADYLDAVRVAQSITVTLSSPSITAALTSTRPASAAGWYRTPVTVTFTCDDGGVALVAPCPDPVVLSTSGKGLAVTRTVTTTDGATDSVTAVVNLDRVKPTVKIKGIVQGRTYSTVPKVRCVGKDTLSGLASCKAKVRKKGSKLIFSATAVDKAGNRRTVKGTAILKPGS